MDASKASYVNVLSYIERLHRRLLDVIKDALDRQGEKEINAVQALLLYNIGGEKLTAGELRSRGCYLGSNVSYNLSKLVAGGYVNHSQNQSDKRSVFVTLSAKGARVHDLVEGLYSTHLENLKAFGIDGETIDGLETNLSRIERFLEDQVRFRL